MARFVAFYNLCPVEDNKEFLGLSRDRDEGNIISTFGRNIIIIIKLSTQKQIRSWTVLDKLSNKVVYDPKSEHYVGVFSCHFLRCWTADEIDINKKKKIKFQKPILDLVSHDNDEILVLYADGTCEFLSSAIESRKSQQHSETMDSQTYSEINDAKIVFLDNDQKMITYFTKSSDAHNVSLIAATLNSDTGRHLNDIKQFKLDRHDQNIGLIGQAVVEGQQYPFLLSLWSDRRIFMLPLKADVNENDSPGNFISMIDLLNVDQPVSILGISKDCVAFYGSNSVQEGSSLLLYNTQFRVVNSKQFFKIYFNYSRLWLIGNNILLAMGQNLYVVSFRVSKELLSEMIGSQISNESHGLIGKEFIQEEDEIEDFLKFDRRKQYINSAQTINTQRCVRQADGKFNPYQRYEIFKENMSYIISRNSSIHVNLIAMNEFVIDLKTHSYDAEFCTEELDTIAKQLEECGASEQEITEKILTVALKATLTDDIIVCIKKYSNISEKLLAKVLKHAINNLTSDVFAELSNGENLTTQIRQKLRLFNTVFASSINAPTIVFSIKKELCCKEAMLYMEYLFFIINSSASVLESHPVIGLDFNQDVLIMQWLSIILDAYFQELGLSPDPTLIVALNKWKELLVSYQQDLRCLQSLYPIVKNLVDRKISNNENRHCKWYSIEEVQMF